MPRMARVVIPNIPHHVIQRGNRRQAVFFSESDYEFYKKLTFYHCRREAVAIWAYCLMPNHVHLILVPETEDGLRKALAEIHRRYTLFVNIRAGWTGCLWQGRFSSYPMDERHLYHAVRYVELNPVRAGLCRTADQWDWSSAKAHLSGKNDIGLEMEPLRHRVTDWQAYLNEHEQEGLIGKIEEHSKTGRPLGSENFIERLESLAGRPLRPQRRGPKPKSKTINVSN